MGPHIFVWFVCVSLLDSLFQVRRHLSINVNLVLLLQLSHQKAVGIQSFLCTTASRSQSGGRDWCVESNYELHCLHGCDLHMLHWDLDYVFRPWMHVAAGSSMLVRLLCRLNKDWPPTTCCISDSSLTGFSFGVGLQQHRFSSGSVGEEAQDWRLTVADTCKHRIFTNSSNSMGALSFGQQWSAKICMRLQCGFQWVPAVTTYF